MTVNLVKGDIFLKNQFPQKGSISSIISLAMIMTSILKPNIFKNMILHSAYTIIFTKSKNNMKVRSVLEISVKLQNLNRGYYFISLLKGKEIYGYQQKELSIDTNIISRVKELAVQ